MSMRKVIVVSVREYFAAVKSKAFVITLVAMPVFMSLGIVAQAIFEDKVDIATKKLAVIDDTGVLYGELERAAEERNSRDVFEKDKETNQPTSKQILPKFVLERVDASGRDRDELLLELSRRVRDGKLFAFAEIQADALDPPADSAEPVIRYYSNAPTYFELRRWLRQTVTDVVQGRRFAESGLDAEKVAWATRPSTLEHFGLFARDKTTGEIGAEKVNEAASFLIPVFLLMLMFMVIIVGASPLIQSVLEEKTQRIAEVLLAAVTPFQWMMGKLIGMVGVSITIVLVYMIGGLVVADRYGVMEHVPFHLLGWFLAYLALAVMMFGAVFIAAGAACSDHREAQSAVMPVMILIILPMMVWMNVVREPSSLFSIVVSLFPPATPMLMIIRQAVPPGIPIWQPILGMALVLLTTVLCVFAASRIFRVGILMQGKGASVRDMMRWVVNG
jgi:ABC-type Na+ efflux pump permease subunit